MLYKGINILTTKENEKYIKQIKKVINNFVDGKKRSEMAVIDSFLRVETNDLKLYETTFATIHEIDHFNYVCYTTNGYVLTTLDDKVIYIHPNKNLEPKTKIDSLEFLELKEPKTQVLTTEQISGLYNLKNYLFELDKLKKEEEMVK